MFRFSSSVRCLFAFSLILVVSTAAAEEIPTPQSVLGFQPGADRKLMDYGQLTGYLQQLADLSPRIDMQAVGQTPLGRTMYVVFISSPENIARLDEMREINRRLALDPEIPDHERIGLVESGRVFVMEALSMHSGEVGPSQSLALFAYQMATTDDPEILTQMDNVVQMFVPCHNPDGMDMVVEHYRKYLGTKYEGSRLPQVYHKYVGHDNNRDFVALTQEDTRVIARLYSTEWYPQVMVEKHQMGSTGPRYYVPPNHDPIAQVIDEGLWNWSKIFGANLQRDMTAAGNLGVASHWVFDDYWPGSTETSLWKNMISFLTEAASCRTATPIFVEPTELSVRGKGLSEYKKGVNLPAPWPGGRWGLDDIVDFELSSMYSILGTASRHRAEILRFRNDLCRKEVAKGRSQAPYYYVMPLDQWDAGELQAMVDLLEMHGVMVSRLTEDAVIGDLHFSQGDFVVALSQPYRAFVKEMMEHQVYPERHYTPDGELIEPYDITSWSLPLHMGVEAIQVDTRSEDFESKLEETTGQRDAQPVELPDGVWGIAYSANQNQSYRAAFAGLAAGLQVSRFTGPFGPEGDAMPPGSFVILAGTNGASTLQKIVDQTAVQPVVFDSEIAVARIPLRNPRIALVETSFHDMDAGWTRYLFDTYGIEFTVLEPGDFEGADFRQFDVVVFPSASKDVLTKGKYKRGDRYVANDFPPEYRKPISKKGLGKLTEFIVNGGTVVSWGESTALFTDGLEAAPVENGEDDTIELPVRDISADARKKDLSVPGAFLVVDYLPGHPVTWGMQPGGGAFSRGYPVLQTAIPSLDTDRRVVAVHPDRDLLLSGYIDGEEALQNRPAGVWVRAGTGQLVLFSIRPQHRGSVPATFKLVFNSLLLPPIGGQ